MMKEGPFEFTKTFLKMFGIMKAEGRYKWVYWLCEGVVSLSLCWVWFPLGLSFLQTTELDYTTILFAVLSAIANFHILCKFLVLRRRAPKILALIRSLEDLTERAIDSYPEEAPVFASATRTANIIPKVIFSTTPESMVSVFALVVMFVVPLGAGLYRKKEPYPFLRIPMESFEGLCLVQTFSSIIPAAALAALYALLPPLAANTATHISLLCKRLNRLSPSDEFPAELRNCIHLHNAIISLVDDMNSIFGDLLFQEILLSSFQCCLAAYLCSQEMKELTKVNNIACFGFAVSTLMPYIICYCGELIKDASSKVTFAAYSSPWYIQTNKDKKRIRLMMTVANRHLTLHYKNFITFDIHQYSLVLQSAYSYFTVLKSLGLE